MTIWYVDIYNITISKLVETKSNSKYLIGCLNEVLRPSFLILPKTKGYLKAFKGKNNKLMSFRIDDDKLLENYQIIWSKTEDLKNIELNALPA